MTLFWVETKVVTHHSADGDKHPNDHWEGAKAKVDDKGAPRTNDHGQVKYESQKTKVEYKESAPAKPDC